jgi:hypothetical protein
MKKVIMTAVAALVLSGLALAQTYTSGTGITGIDKLGAHQNGGRGCTGCHAPHSGGQGGGGNKATGASFNDPYSGNDALWGEDVTPLLGYSIVSGGGSYTDTLPGTVGGGVNSANYATANATETEGLMFCLSCHDGNVAKGGMMTNQLYEQRIGVLPTGLYGPGTIPTLLGNDGTTAGNYQNDHPVGPAANLGAVGVSGVFSLNAAGTSVAYNATLASTAKEGVVGAYAVFASNYGAPAQGRMTFALPTGASNSGQAYIVCTTCHTPHTMYTASGIYAPSSASGTYPTYFFLVMPYNPGSIPIAGATGKQASSATQFCRQCHFTGAGGSNEGSGINTVTTAF